MKPAKLLFFDLNSTLVDPSGIQESVQRTSGELAASRPGFHASRLLEANGEVWRAYWPEVEDRWTVGVLDSATLSLEDWSRAARVRYHADSVARQ
jgi:hypothetical protein